MMFYGHETTEIGNNEPEENTMKMKQLLILAIACQASFAMANYTNFIGEAGNPWGYLLEPTAWEGGVVPSGSTTGVVSDLVVDAWGSHYADIAIRQIGIYVGNAQDKWDGTYYDPNQAYETLFNGGSVAGVVGTIYEIDDPRTDYASYTNFCVGKLAFWSQHGGKMAFSILSGHVELKELRMAVTPDQATLNMGNGILHAVTNTLNGLQFNMLAGGSGNITVDDAGFDVFHVNFESDSMASFTIGNKNGGPTAGVWEWAIGQNMISIDGTVATNLSSYKIDYYPDTEHGSTNSTRIRLVTALSAQERYELWAAGYGLTDTTNGTGSATYDVEPDGLDNLTEYALGGNPIIDDADTINPTISGPVPGTNTMAYIYNRRLDAAALKLSYALTVTTDDLKMAAWTSLPVGSLETGSAPIDAFFESVTNEIPTDTPFGFVNLEVTENF